GVITARRSKCSPSKWRIFARNSSVGSITRRRRNNRAMRFLLRKKRQPPAVIIVALIDVLIVLLIFLMVTSSAKKPLSAVRLDLPESTQAAKVGANEAPPFLIVIEASGVLRYGENAKVVTSDELKQALLQAAAANPKLKVSISADKGAP